MASINRTELVNIIEEVLNTIDIPVSISLINTTLKSLCKMDPIEERFFIEHNNRFYLQVIGCDLKISLGPDSSNGGENKINNNAKLICSVIERDIRKLEEIKKSLQSEDVSEILYDNMVSKFGSKKKPINIAFVVRNSHNLELFKRKKQTFVRIIDKDKANFKMNHTEIMTLYQQRIGLQEVLSLCLRNLLSSFEAPQDLGALQASFSFADTPIDNRFLKANSQYFRCFQKNNKPCVELLDAPKDELYRDTGSKFNSIPQLTNITSTKQPSPDTMQGSSYKSEKSAVYNEEKPEETLALLVQNNKKDLIDCAQRAIEQNQSLIIVGDKDKEPLFLDQLPDDNNYRISVLQKIKRLVEEELVILKS